MRLSALVPVISAEIVKKLESSGIRTDADLLFVPNFQVYKRLPRGTINLQDLTRLCTLVTELTSAEPILGSELLRQEEEHLAQDRDLDLSVGDEPIDVLLSGLGGRRIIEISGDRSSGKTALALNIVLHHLSRLPNDTAAWIDVVGDFSPARASTILKALGCKQQSTFVLERLTVSLAFELESLYAALDELFQVNPIGTVPRYLVIDAITPILGPMLSGITAHGHAIMTDLMRQLRTLSKTHGTTILVTIKAARALTVINIHISTQVINNATLKRSKDGAAPMGDIERKPALGPSFTFMTDTTLWLSEQKHSFPVNGDETVPSYLLKILKSRNKASRSSQQFSIVGGRTISR